LSKDNVVYINKPTQLVREEALESHIKLVQEAANDGEIDGMFTVLVRPAESEGDTFTILISGTMAENHIETIGILELVKLNIVAGTTDAID